MIDELIDLLSRLLLEGFITEDEAVEIIISVQATGQLPPGWQLPLTIAESMPSTLRQRLSEALIFFANNVPPPSPDVAQLRYIEEALQLSRDWSAGRMSLQTWQRRMLDLLIDYYARQAQEGAQRNIVDEEPLFARVEVQIAYFSRFADQIGTGRISNDDVRKRTHMYAGEGRAIYYEQQGLANAQYGWVEDYIAVDDRNTCGPCSNAEANGPYLPGRGPMPGAVCLGRGFCRCLRLLRYDEAAYLRLGGT